ncbi:helix-turn-helix domain-containing protein [Providencia sp. Me31A]|uniref:helix-turn-helix domain-containing protein n=1 Tax=Providencia sp. Me31A TaxID=3392637 RepID=UPI003D268AD7
MLNTKYEYSNELNFKAGREIRKLRMEYGWSGGELAEKLDISQQQVSRYENGVNKINIELLVKLSFIFQVPVCHFLYLVEN